MALKKNETVQAQIFAHTNLGIQNLNETRSIEISSYFKVQRVNADKNTAMAFVSNSSGDTKEFVFKVDLDGANFIKQAYNHLKTLPEFSGATDC
jgi:hypothetical protein